MKKWQKYLGIGFLAFTGLGVIAVATDDSKTGEAAPSPGDNPQPRNLSYTVGSKDASSRQITYRLVIPERAAKEDLIEITRKLKEETGWKDELVCYFNIGAHSTSGAWASCAYLPRCESCPNDKDKDGNGIQYDRIGMTASLADSLQKLTLDSIDNKQFICSYIDDGWDCKVELYTVNNDPSRILKARLTTYGTTVDWLTVKQKDGETRYYYEDEPDGDGFIQVDKATKEVHLRTEGNKTWQTYRIAIERGIN